MDKPIIELKKVSVNKRMSEETHCYSADLYVDGVKWGEVCNRGHGGGDDFRGVAGKDYDDLNALDKVIAATYDKVDCTDMGMPGETLDMSLEIICGDLVNDFLMEKEAKAVVKNKIAFTKEPLKAGVALYTLPLKGHPEAKGIELVRKGHPNAVILNELDITARVAALRMAG